MKHCLIIVAFALSLSAFSAVADDAPPKAAPKKPVKNQIVAKVKAIDEKMDAITLAGEEKNGKPGPDRTFTLTNDAKIRIDGGFVRLIDVPVGSEVAVVLNAEKLVMSITVNAKIKPDKKK